MYKVNIYISIDGWIDPLRRGGILKMELKMELKVVELRLAEAQMDQMNGWM